MVDSFDSGIVKSEQVSPHINQPLQNFANELYSGKFGRLGEGGYSTEIKMTEDGPQIKEERIRKSEIDPDLKFSPASSLTPEVKAAIEAKPVLPEEDTITCAPMSKEQEEKYAGQTIGLKCDEKPVSEWTEYQKEKYQRQHQIHITPDTMIAKTDDGYLVFHPIPDILNSK